MRTLLLCLALVVGVRAAEAAGPRTIGNVVDVGTTFGPGPELFIPSANNTATQYVAYRFTAHQSAPVYEVGLEFSAIVNHNGGPSSFTADVYAASGDGSTPVTTSSFFHGTFTSSDFPIDLTTLLVISGTASGSLVSGSTYFLVVGKTSSGNGFKPLLAQGLTSVDPIYGFVEPYSRDTLAGSVTADSSGTLGPVSWSSLGRTGIFVVEYDTGINNGCQGGASYSANPAEGFTYRDEFGFVLQHNETAGEQFAARLAVPASVGEPLRLFAIDLPLTIGSGAVANVRFFDASTASSPLLGSADMVNGDGSTFAGTYAWRRGPLTNPDAGAISLSLSNSADYLVSLKNNGSGTVTLPAYTSSSTNLECSLRNRVQYLGGYHYANAFAYNGTYTGNQDDTAVPFRLCTNEVAGNDVDEDCNGVAEATAGDTFTACHDHDGDGFGSSADTLTLGKTLWQTSPPPGYVADCSDCDDNNAAVHDSCGTSSSSTSGSGSTSSSGSTGTSSSSGSTGSSSSSSGTSSTGSTSSGSTGTASASTGSSGTSTTGSSSTGSGTTGHSSGSSGTETTGGATTTVVTTGSGGAGGSTGTLPDTFKLGGCGCGSASAGDLAGMLAGLAILARRRRR